MNKKIILILCSFLFGYFHVHALDSACTVAEQNRLKTLASQVYFSYELKKVPTDSGVLTATYEVSVSGLISDLYIYDIKKAIYFAPNDGKIATSLLAPGKSYTLPFYASDSGVCNGYLITTKYITLPAYNVYSEDPLCVGNEEYILCNPSSSIKVSTQEEFEARVKAYIATKSKQTTQTQEEITTTEKTTAEKVLDFLSNYYMYISGGTILLGTVGIIIAKRNERKEIL